MSALVDKPTPAAGHTAATATATVAPAAAPAWGGKKVWGAAPRAATQPMALSLRDIQVEEQRASDAELARRLQAEEEVRTGTTVKGKGKAAAVDVDVDVAGDEALARRLQAEEQGGAVPPTTTAAGGAGAAATPAAEEMDDHTLALLLQAEFDNEHDQEVTARELRENMYLSSSKVSVSMNHLRRMPVDEHWHAGEAEEAPEPTDDGDEIASYDRGTKSFRDAGGSIVTKHNAAVCGRRNRRKMEKFPLSCDMGDMGTHDDFRISNKVYNSLKRFSVKNEKQRARLHEKKEHSTSVLALDAKTRLILYKLVSAGLLEEVNGCISTGKEAVVFQGTRRLDPEVPDSPIQQVAIKVFKTTITEFKNRAQFLNGDRRYEARIGKQSVRKLVKIWAEKEMYNLSRMRSAGLRCPDVILQRQHVLVMSCIGGQAPAPKLKDVPWGSGKRLAACYERIKADLRTLFQDCRLVHADFSEYNVLYHNREPWLIDVGQAVEPTHPNAMAYLMRDCTSITRFFKAQGAQTLSAEELFVFVTGQSLEDTAEQEIARRMQKMKGALEREEAADMSNVCLTFEKVSMDNKDLLLQGLGEDEASSEEDGSQSEGEGRGLSEAVSGEAQDAAAPALEESMAAEASPSTTEQ